MTTGPTTSHENARNGRVAMWCVLLVVGMAGMSYAAVPLYRCRDYERVGVPMLPVVAGLDETRRQILLYSIALAPLGVLPVATGLGGVAYAIGSTGLGAVFVKLAWDVYRNRDGRDADATAKRLFRFSILYLAALFLILLGEHTVRHLSFASGSL